MKTSTAIFAIILSAGLVHAEDGKTYSYRTGRAGVPQQSQKEVEDIGEISESSGGSSKWRMNLSTRGQYTSNSRLSGNHGSGDFLLLPTFEVGYHTPLGKHFSFDFSTKIESAIFGDRSDRSFVGYSALATLDYTYRQGLPRAYVSVEPYRFDGFDSGELATQAVGFTGGTDWGYGFNAGRSVVFTGVSYSYYLADPSVDSRNTYRAVAGLAHQIRSNLTGQAYYAYQHNDYTDFARNDSRHVLAGNLIYQFAEHFFGTMSTTWVNNDSSQARGSYQSFGAGLGLTLQY
jgi:hypothetical protein